MDAQVPRAGLHRNIARDARVDTARDARVDTARHRPQIALSPQMIRDYTRDFMRDDSLGGVSP